MSVSTAYFEAMKAGRLGECCRIERKHNLFGYPPEIVSVGLKAVDEGRDVNAAVSAYIAGEDA